MIKPGSWGKYIQNMINSKNNCHSFQNYLLRLRREIWISRRNSRLNLKDASAVSRNHRKKERQISFKTEAGLGYITFSKCCWRLHSTLACAVSFPNGVSPGNFWGVPISSSASAPKKILSSKSPTVRTYSSYSLFTALLQRELFLRCQNKT
jgi:hypothetical protein